MHEVAGQEKASDGGKWQYEDPKYSLGVLCCWAWSDGDGDGDSNTQRLRALSICQPSVLKSTYEMGIVHPHFTAEKTEGQFDHVQR